MPQPRPLQRVGNSSVNLRGTSLLEFTATKVSRTHPAKGPDKKQHANKSYTKEKGDAEYPGSYKHCVGESWPVWVADMRRILLQSRSSSCRRPWHPSWPIGLSACSSQMDSRSNNAEQIESRPNPDHQIRHPKRWGWGAYAAPGLPRSSPHVPRQIETGEGVRCSPVRPRGGARWGNICSSN